MQFWQAIGILHQPSPRRGQLSNGGRPMSGQSTTLAKHHQQGTIGKARTTCAGLAYSITSSARASRVVGTLRPMPLLGGRPILEDQAEQEMHVGAVGSAFRRLGSIGSPHLAQVPYVPSDIRFRAASIWWISVVSVFFITSSAS